MENSIIFNGDSVMMGIIDPKFKESNISSLHETLEVALLRSMDSKTKKKYNKSLQQCV